MSAAVRTKVIRDGSVHDVASSPTFDKPGISTKGQAFFILMEGVTNKLEAMKNMIHRNQP